ncbi:MAG: hypothetical protein RSB38_08740 [Oscillospiraceae bacterium]
MTHPDIKRVEATGYLYSETSAKLISGCQYCGTEIYDDGYEYIKSADGIFCTLDCCHEYYGIAVVN